LIVAAKAAQHRQALDSFLFVLYSFLAVVLRQRRSCQTSIKRSVMLQRTVGVLFSLGLVAGLFVNPLIGNAQESPKPGAQSPVAAKASSAVAAVVQTSKPRREPTEAQLAARERRVKCGAEWRAAKEKGAVEEGATWPKYWSACNRRLKDQGA
jgi:hypothetical protein